MHALVSIFIKHCLCNAHPFYQSDSSVSAAFIISSVVVELCACVLELLFTYPCRANLGRYAIFQFMLQLYTGWFTKILKNVERLGGRAKTLSNLGILKIKLTFYLWGLSIFNIHRMLHEDQGNLLTT
jgi:hypothetical protein